MDKIKEIRVFAVGMSFPVLLFVCDDRQHELVAHLAESVRVTQYRTEDICRWCEAHRIEYDIFTSKLDVMLPWRRIAYRRITRQIGGDAP